ncbi:MAG: tRNA (adenosine(37)-N6)-threonylcarbamoyltransferase complex transferase subunit TsaD [Candidatus Omnitrophica bacterium]|nr:tRNA (adenosine(37)-N6)-threonylcarbamoyltransferase complex transferase subunit TsaD [Candidatus Omnitrophota bacterium]
MLVLGIETSCDETACAVVENGERILSSCVTSSVSIHEKFGGIVPEVASRYHVEFILPVLEEALKEANVRIEDIDLVAATYGPGLVGSLLTGINMAKAFSLSQNKPFVAVNHLAAHLYASFMVSPRPELPAVGLIVSGGHTELVLIKDFGHMEILGRTRDDAAGEAFDKVAKILGLGYPGGPVIDRLAAKGNPKKIKFTSGRFKDSLDFSFSGIKTAVLYYVRKQIAKSGQPQINLSKEELLRDPEAKQDKLLHPGLPDNDINDICAAFQDSVVNVLVDNARRACHKRKINQLVLGGGVSSNSSLREKIKGLATDNITVFIPPVNLCLDNAAMVAGLGFKLYNQSTTGNNLSIEPAPILAL